MQLKATRLTAIASAVKRAIKTFSVRDLFAGGAPGVWYDPSDLTTLFQDSAGTVPVTAVEQPVGLMLDKSQGLVLGPEQYVTGSGAWTRGFFQSTERFRQQAQQSQSRKDQATAQGFAGFNLSSALWGAVTDFMQGQSHYLVALAQQLVSRLATSEPGLRATTQLPTFKRHLGGISQQQRQPCMS